MIRVLLTTALITAAVVAIGCHSVPATEKPVSASGANTPASASANTPANNAGAATALPAAPGSGDRWTIYCSGFPPDNARENCFMRVAFMTKQASYCASAGSIRGECLTAVARATGDSAPCIDAGGSREVFECMMAATLRAKSDAVCSPFADAAAVESRCLKAGGDKEGCAMWRSKTGTHAIAACKAAASGNRAACEALPPHTDSAREACLHALAVRSKDTTLCRALHEPGSAQLNLKENACVADAATAKLSATECAFIVHGKANPVGDVDYSVCMMAAAAKDPSACDRLPPPEAKEQAAIARRLCLANGRVGAPDTGMADALMHWQMSMKDVALCREAPGDQSCFLTVALNTRQKTACEALYDEPMKAACAKLTAP